MLNEFNPGMNSNANPQTGLHALVDRITSGSIAAATSRRSFIINDVPTGMLVNNDENMIAAVFGNLLNTLITHTRDCCIRVSAKIYGKVALLSIKESHQANGKNFAANIRQIQQLAARIGGTVSLSYDQKKTTTLIFSFTNNLPLAA